LRPSVTLHSDIACIVLVLDEESYQKSCLLDALHSEKTMLQENVKTKRDEVNVLAQKSAQVAK
jgi:hypothetical protein